ncbi:MAG: hypothetical protein ABIH03_08630 [Pseudomonadota bacterium]
MIAVPGKRNLAIIDKLSAEIATIMALPDIRDRLVAQGMDPFISTPHQFAELLKVDMATYGRIVKTANTKFEQWSLICPPTLRRSLRPTGRMQY